MRKASLTKFVCDGDFADDSRLFRQLKKDIGMYTQAQSALHLYITLNGLLQNMQARMHIFGT